MSTTPLAVSSLALALATGAHAAMTGCVVTAADFVSSNAETGGFSTYTRYQVYARFDGASDTLLACTNFCGIGFPCGGGSGDLYGGFWHYDTWNTGLMLSTDYGDVPGGSWDPSKTGSATLYAPRDSFLTIGGLPVGTNTTDQTPDWTSGGTGIHAGNARSWDRPDLVDNCLIGWFNSNPANLQGRVGVGSNSATDVLIGQFVLLASEAARTYQLTFAYNDGSIGAATFFQTCQFEIGLCPSPGAVALFGLAGVARRRRR